MPVGVAATGRFAATVAVKVTRPLASWGLISWPSAVVVGVASTKKWVAVRLLSSGALPVPTAVLAVPPSAP